MANHLSPSKCVVLVPVGHSIVPECEAALLELERRGYTVRRVRGYSLLDAARNQMATDALRDGFEETMWIDSDVVFDPEAVEQLRSHDLPITCGIYPKKGKRELAIHVLPGTKEIVFGDGGGLVQILYGATGFLHVRREIYDSIRIQLDLPVCNEQFGSPMVPYFLPMVINQESEPWYLGEDYAFSERVRQCGHAIYADSQIRIYHMGLYGFSWEEAGGPKQRFASYRFRLT